MTPPGRPLDTLPMTLVGGPTVLLRYAGLTVLTDPTFDPPGPYPPSPLVKTTGPALAPDDLGPVDLVLLSHDQHPDNLDVTGRAVLADARAVLTTPLAAGRLPGVPGLRGIGDGEQVTVGRVVVTAVPARHGPPGIEPHSGPVTGFVLEADGAPTVYVSGDNAAVEHVEAVAARFPDVAVAVLHVGAARVAAAGPDPLTLDAPSAVRAARALPGAVVVPVHAEGWSHFSETADDVVRAFAAAGLADRLQVLPRGERVEVVPTRRAPDGTPAAVSP